MGHQVKALVGFPRVMGPVALAGEEMVVERGDGQLVVSEVVRGYEF